MKYVDEQNQLIVLKSDDQLNNDLEFYWYPTHN